MEQHPPYWHTYLCFDDCRSGVFAPTHLANAGEHVHVTGDNGRDRVARQAEEQLLLVIVHQCGKRDWLSESASGHINIYYI